MKSYRPSRGFRLSNYLGAILIAGMGVYFLSMLPGSGAPELLLIGVPPLVLGAVWAWRISRLRVTYDESFLYVVGWLRSFKIARAKVLEVDTDPRTARVSWERADGGVATVSLSAVAVGKSYSLPTSTLKEQKGFLVSLKRWVMGR